MFPARCELVLPLHLDVREKHVPAIPIDIPSLYVMAKEPGTDRCLLYLDGGVAPFGGQEHSVTPIFDQTQHHYFIGAGLVSREASTFSPR